MIHHTYLGVACKNLPPGNPPPSIWGRDLAERKILKTLPEVFSKYGLRFFSKYGLDLMKNSFEPGLRSPYFEKNKPGAFRILKKPQERFRLVTPPLDLRPENSVLIDEGFFLQATPRYRWYGV